MKSGSSSKIRRFSSRNSRSSFTSRNASCDCVVTSWALLMLLLVLGGVITLILIIFQDFGEIGSNNLTSAPDISIKLDHLRVRGRSSVSSEDNLMKKISKTSLRGNEMIHATPKSQRKRYCYAITITKDGFFQDGAAVLAYSIVSKSICVIRIFFPLLITAFFNLQMKYSWNASYDISFVAFVHPNVTTSRPGLQRLGFHVIEVPIPINTSAIEYKFLREKINKNGCCGSAELIKLTSYRLLQYDRVIHLDADVIFLNVSILLLLFR